MSALQESLVELIRRTSAEIPEDVHEAIVRSLEEEKKGTIAESAMKIIERNIGLAKQKSQPICQDTGSILFYVDCPVGFDQITFEETTHEAVKLATKKGFLRQNSVDSLTGKNDGTNVGPGSPTVHFHQHRAPEIRVRLILKGGGCAPTTSVRSSTVTVSSSRLALRKTSVCPGSSTKYGVRPDVAKVHCVNGNVFVN